MANDTCASRAADAFQACLKSASNISNFRPDIEKATAERPSNLRRPEELLELFKLVGEIYNFSMPASVFHAPSGDLVSKSSPVSGQTYVCFVPDPLPPLVSDGEMAGLVPLLADASQAFGQLAGFGQLLPNPDLLVRPYMRREAVLSSRIENTYTSFSELVAFEMTREETRGGSNREVLNHVAALDYGLRHIHDAGITMDLVRGIHRTLLLGARGERTSTPGETRLVQNHIGGDSHDPADARFVPPPPELVPGLLDQLFAYTANPKPAVPTLIEAAWMHYQFETIHPFLDGNGRVGRVLIPLLFALRHEMPHPLLYLSPYFEADRTRYYDLLFGVSARSEWASWLRYFLEGVCEQSRTAIELSRQIVDLGVEWHRRLDARKASRNAHRLADYVHRHLGVDAGIATTFLEVTPPTAYASIKTLVEAGILAEYSNRSWGRFYLAAELRDIMEAVT